MNSTNNIASFLININNCKTYTNTNNEEVTMFVITRSPQLQVSLYENIWLK